MRYRKLGAEDVGEAASRRHVDPETGREEYNITDQDLAMSPPLEEEPEFQDILPDSIHHFGTGEEDEERELDAQPSSRINPVFPDELPKE
jgi:hypothetical protein